MTIDEIEPYRAKEINEPYIMMGADVPNSPKRRYTSRSELLNATLPSDDEDGEENDTKDEVFEAVATKQISRESSSESSSESSDAEEEKHEEINSDDHLLTLEEKIDIVISDKIDDKESISSSESFETNENQEELEELPEVVEEPKEKPEPEETAEDVAFKLMTRKPEKNESILHEDSLNITEENETAVKNEQNQIMEEAKTDKMDVEVSDPECEGESDHELKVMEESLVKKSSSSSESSNSEVDPTEVNDDSVSMVIEEAKDINVREEKIETEEPNGIVEKMEDVVGDIDKDEYHSQLESQFADQSLGTLIQTKARSPDKDEISEQEFGEKRIEVNVDAEEISEVEENPALAFAAATENLAFNSNEKNEENTNTEKETFPEPPNLEGQNINTAVDIDEKQNNEIVEPEEVNKNQSMNETVSTLSSTFHRTSSVSSTSDSSAASFTSSNQTEDKTLEDKTEIEPEDKTEGESEDKKVNVKEEVAKFEERSVAIPLNEEITEKLEETGEIVEDGSTSLVETTLSPDTTLPSESSSNHEAATEDLASQTEEEIVTSLVEDALTRTESQLNGIQQTNAEENIVEPEENQEDVKEEKADVIEDEKSKISLKDKIKFFKSEIFRAEQKPAPEKIEPPRISRQVSLSQVFIFSNCTASMTHTV